MEDSRYQGLENRSVCVRSQVLSKTSVAGVKRVKRTVMLEGDFSSKKVHCGFSKTK